MPIESAIAGAVRRLVEDDLTGGVRPWDLPELQRRAAYLGEVSFARAVSVDENVLVAELLPGGERIAFRGVDDEWRLVRFLDGATPYSTECLGVIIDGDRGVLLTGRDDSALVTEG